MPEPPESEVSQAARALSARGASKGGKARAEKLTAEERREIARKAAEARWATDAVQATHTGTLEIAGNQIACAVLADGTRILTQESFLSAIGRARKAKAGTGSQLMQVDALPPFLSANNLKPFVAEELRRSTTPILFRTPSGGRGYGYKAEILPMVCEVYLKARDRDAITRGQAHIVEACDLLMRGLARVGIVALVDEATGYQEDRARDALAEILATFISEELRKWVKTFPDAYFRELARLRGIHLSRVSVKRPQYIGHLTNDLVYKRLAPGVLRELQRITPRTRKGHRKHAFHQRLSEDAGHPKLREHLASVITLMRAFDNWDDFKKALDRSLPKHKDMPLFDHLKED